MLIYRSCQPRMKNLINETKKNSYLDVEGFDIILFEFQLSYCCLVFVNLTAVAWQWFIVTYWCSYLYETHRKFKFVDTSTKKINYIIYDFCWTGCTDLYQTITDLCGDRVKDCSLVSKVWSSMSDRILSVPTCTAVVITIQNTTLLHSVVNSKLQY